MRVICDVELCQGHGRCEAMAPEVFKLDSNGYLVTPVIEVPPGLEERARIGAESCPEEILRIEED
jgi:ferredoxin